MLSARKIRAVEYLYLGFSEEEVGEKIGCSGALIAKWKRDKEFAQALIDISARKLADLVPKAIMNIKDILYDKNVKPDVRLKASLAVLELGKIAEKNEDTKVVNLKVEYI